MKIKDNINHDQITHRVYSRLDNGYWTSFEELNHDQPYRVLLKEQEYRDFCKVQNGQDVVGEMDLVGFVQEDDERILDIFEVKTYLSQAS